MHIVDDATNVAELHFDKQLIPLLKLDKVYDIKMLTNTLKIISLNTINISLKSFVW